MHYCNKDRFDKDKFDSKDIKYFKGDLLEFESIENLIKDFVKEFGGIDILINNAGFISNYLDWNELTEQEFDDVFNLNVKAPLWLSKNAFKYMKENKEGGRIINLSSINVKHGGSSKSAYYVASKSALETLSRIFAKEGAKHNILVNTIRVGVIDSGMYQKVKNYSKENFEDRKKYVPLCKAGEPIDIANMVLYLSGEKSKFITGQIFAVSGGE
jgi:3-oxoacyl-[acyl-carrier protein] reductase